MKTCMKILFPILAVSAILLQSGCATAPHAGPPPMPAEVAQAAYLIGIDDRLSVHVWRDDEMSSDVAVRQDGKVSMPLIGDVMAAGKKPTELASDIQEALGRYLKAPRVTVSVTEMRSNAYLSRVRVTGAVSQPVSMPFRRGMTVLDAVLEAGGPAEYAAVDRARLVRVVDGQPQQYQLKLGAILQRGELDTNFALYPGDVIAVPERML